MKQVLANGDAEQTNRLYRYLAILNETDFAFIDRVHDQTCGSRLSGEMVRFGESVVEDPTGGDLNNSKASAISIAVIAFVIIVSGIALLGLHQACKTRGHIWCTPLDPHLSSVRHPRIGPS